MPACPRCGAETQETLAPDEICTECAAKEAAAIQQALHYQPKIHLTNALIFANALLFLVMLAQGAIYVPEIFGIALPQFRGEQLLQWGANWGPLSLTFQPWRLWTSNYLHGGLFHIFTNMFCLWGLGRLVESFYSKADFLMAYTFTGVCGSLLSVLINPISSPSVGASGAVFGLAGLMLATMKLGHIPLPNDVRNSIYTEVLKFAGLNLVIGLFIPHVDNMGHLGGLLSGVLAGGLLGRRLDRSEASVSFRRKAWGVLLLLFVVGVWGAMRFHHRLIYSVFRIG